MNAEQKIAITNIINILIALADHTGMNDLATKNLVDAAAAFGITSKELVDAAKMETRH